MTLMALVIPAFINPPIFRMTCDELILVKKKLPLLRISIVPVVNLEYPDGTGHLGIDILNTNLDTTSILYVT